MTQQAKPLADLWFGVEAVDDGLLRLREAHIDPFLAGNIWLLRGEHRSLLIDSGTGIMPLRPLVSALAGQPVAAVALNRFYDHAGGLYEFDERLAHEAERAAHEHPSAETSVAADYVSDAMLRALPCPETPLGQSRCAGVVFERDAHTQRVGQRVSQREILPAREVRRTDQRAPAAGFLKPGPVAIRIRPRTLSGLLCAKCNDTRPPKEIPPSTARRPGAAQSSTRPRSPRTRSSV